MRKAELPETEVPLSEALFQFGAQFSSCFAGKSFTSTFMITMSTMATVKIPNIPNPITLRDSIKFVIMMFLLFYAIGMMLSSSPPAMTDAIWPDTLTLVACMRMMLVGSSFSPI